MTRQPVSKACHRSATGLLRLQGCYSVRSQKAAPVAHEDMPCLRMPRQVAPTTSDAALPYKYTARVYLSCYLCTARAWLQDLDFDCLLKGRLRESDLAADFGRLADSSGRVKRFREFLYPRDVRRSYRCAARGANGRTSLSRRHETHLRQSLSCFWGGGVGLGLCFPCSLPVKAGYHSPLRASEPGRTTARRRILVRSRRAPSRSPRRLILEQ